ncbi:hypothetical protein EYF80_001355 [Liparis tanakae]|uniref:Uncharacterized protein n=1 Tax=Liparis tanakae TaxID=230148 RepID=A0A4Z2JH49_9TELE|nr:hypothetical protein EYF80_001355 [Liparis tanakae]
MQQQMEEDGPKTNGTEKHSDTLCPTFGISQQFDANGRRKSETRGCSQVHKRVEPSKERVEPSKERVESNKERVEPSTHECRRKETAANRANSSNNGQS